MMMTTMKKIYGETERRRRKCKGLKEGKKNRRRKLLEMNSTSCKMMKHSCDLLQRLMKAENLKDEKKLKT